MRNAKFLYSKPKKSTTKGFVESDGHNVFYRYIQRNPNYENVFVLHGGPGSNLSSEHPRYLSPNKYNIVQFDYRCCGKSTSPKQEPFKDVGVLQSVGDIERIRQVLSLDKITLFALSWGGTPAIAYASIYPQNVNKVIVFNPLILDKDNRNWLFSENGLITNHPEFRPYFNRINKEDFANQILFKQNTEYMMYWLYWESCLANLQPPTEINAYLQRRCCLAMQYFHKDMFLQGDNLTECMKSIPCDIPVFYLSGGFDISVSPQTSENISKHVPNSKITIMSNLGHSMVGCLEWNKVITDFMDNIVN